MNNTHEHYIIISAIILGIGSLAGITNFLNYYYKSEIKNRWEIVKYVLGGIGAAILVPLFLNMLSSDLIKESEKYNFLNYFIFAGFCFIAGYFSNRFINSIGDKILKDLENTKIQVQENEAKIDLMVASETESDEINENTNIDFTKFSNQSLYTDDPIDIQINQIIKSFTNNFKFRTVKGISKELNYPESVTINILKGLEKNGITKQFKNNEGKTLWSLTHMGVAYANSLQK
ncbi:YEATS-associated helix-containing protein [Myroides sp. DF42-4-2]|uniref:YEATS-associated helix-containing protein n=1 Tax=unclassified Myroides TaxID=2642485 RepID=UPI002577A195|nr:YEATS-associated helix-containing protein [Myroides sp. DF42-4-2]MDM1407570.1 hypothetical protein [Myroides sp. DF42-4-2]